MLISFFEEFPTEESLAKLKYVTWPTKLYIAANSVHQFRAVTSTLKRNKNLLEAVYWPVLEKKDGYWISPFSRQSALQGLFEELEHTKIPVMLDLELPTTRNPWLYLTEMLHFQRDKKMIRSFIHQYQGDTYLCEYAAPEKGLQRLGLHYPDSKSKVMKMLYNSTQRFDEASLLDHLQKDMQKFSKRYIVGYGTIAIGVGGDEPLLSPRQLEKDLEIAQKAGVQEVVIFRLGGLNSKYLKVMGRFV